MTSQDIVLFVPKKRETQYLNEAMRALKSLRVKNYFVFAHIGSQQSFIQNMDLLSQITLETNNNVLNQKNETMLEDLAVRLETRPALKSLFHAIGPVQKKVSECSSKELLIASMVKGLLSEAPLVIVECIDEHADPFLKALFKKAILEKNEKDKTNFLILTHDAHYWSELCDKSITYNEDLSYSLNNLEERKTKNTSLTVHNNKITPLDNPLSLVQSLEAMKKIS
ncbi:hypothetical protein HBN50_06515 [Halobacteriovorax sp. GB3]|nr:hypothetical protein [Halobacteriovorax sp. GB3]